MIQTGVKFYKYPQFSKNNFKVPIVSEIIMVNHMTKYYYYFRTQQRYMMESFDVL